MTSAFFVAPCWDIHEIFAVNSRTPLPAEPGIMAIHVESSLAQWATAYIYEMNLQRKLNSCSSGRCSEQPVSTRHLILM